MTIETGDKNEDEIYLEYLYEQKKICWSEKALENIEREIAEYEEKLNKKENQ